MKSHSNNIKCLILITVLSLSINNTYAQDGLHPDMDKIYQEESKIPSTSSKLNYPESGYKLTKISEGGEKPQGDNIVTDYLYNLETGDVIPVYYRLELKKINYGSGNTVKYLRWETDETGKHILVETSKENAVITINYTTPAQSHQHIDNNSKTEYTDGLTADFKNLNVSSTSAKGAAIFNKGEFGDVTGNFVNNSVNATSSSASGGAIYNNKGVFGNIKGDFISNSAVSDSSSAKTSGGAVYNSGQITSIQGNFINNSASSKLGEVEGGAVLNAQIIGNINGNFIGNYVTSAGKVLGGAIYNNFGQIETITGNFIANYASSTSSSAYGGALHNYQGTINNIIGNFIGNYVYSSSTSVNAGAVYNSGDINNIIGDFIGNYALANKSGSATGGAVYNSGGSINNITGDFIGNHTNSFATANFYSSAGGAIHNSSSNSEIQNINGNFNENYSIGKIDTYGGAIYNNGKIENISGNFTGNYVNSSGKDAKGGAIYNTSSIDEISGNFLNNYAKSEGTGTAKGGAIYSKNDLIISANNTENIFAGNYTEINGEKDDNAIYLDNANATLTFKLQNSGKIIMKDNINGVEGYKVNIQGDNIDKTVFYLHNDIKNADISIGNTTLNTIDNKIHTYNFNSFMLDGDINMAVDVDLANKSMDRITSNSYGSHSGNLFISGMNIISDSQEGQNITEILFAEKDLKDKVVNNVNNIPTTYQSVAYSPIFKYHVNYDNRQDGGYFIFGREDQNNYTSYNPSVMVSPVASQLGGYLVQLNSYDQAFMNIDNRMLLTSAQRAALKAANKFSIIKTPNDKNYLSTEYQENSGWFRPYSSFENVNLNNGPKVSNIMYGSFFGSDSEIYELKNGKEAQFSVYAGYNGSHQSFAGNSLYQNGGTFGLSGAVYKGNFFSALTANIGAGIVDASTMYGNETFPMLMTGIASKTGYNWEFAGGKFIIQPGYLMSYSFINSFDYTNSAGVAIDSSPLHAINISPGIKFISNLKNGWQPYASVHMIWNLLDKTDVEVQQISLPYLSVKPYIEYGFGIQKRWDENVSCFVQAMVRNGGRNGIALSLGYRHMLGKSKKEKVTVPQI